MPLHTALLDRIDLIEKQHKEIEALNEREDTRQAPPSFSYTLTLLLF